MIEESKYGEMTIQSIVRSIFMSQIFDKNNGLRQYLSNHNNKIMDNVNFISDLINNNLNNIKSQNNIDEAKFNTLPKVTIENQVNLVVRLANCLTAGKDKEALLEKMLSIKNDEFKNELAIKYGAGVDQKLNSDMNYEQKVDMIYSILHGNNENTALREIKRKAASSFLERNPNIKYEIDVKHALEAMKAKSINYVIPLLLSRYAIHKYIKAGSKKAIKQTTQMPSFNKDDSNVCECYFPHDISGTAQAEIQKKYIDDFLMFAIPKHIDEFRDVLIAKLMGNKIYNNNKDQDDIYKYSYIALFVVNNCNEEQANEEKVNEEKAAVLREQFRLEMGSRIRKFPVFYQPSREEVQPAVDEEQLKSISKLIKDATGEDAKGAGEKNFTLNPQTVKETRGKLLSMSRQDCPELPKEEAAPSMLQKQFIVPATVNESMSSAEGSASKAKPSFAELYTDIIPLDNTKPPQDKNQFKPSILYTTINTKPPQEEAAPSMLQKQLAAVGKNMASVAEGSALEARPLDESLPYDLKTGARSDYVRQKQTLKMEIRDCLSMMEFNVERSSKTLQKSSEELATFINSGSNEIKLNKKILDKDSFTTDEARIYKELIDKWILENNIPPISHELYAKLEAEKDTPISRKDKLDGATSTSGLNDFNFSSYMITSNA